MPYMIGDEQVKRKCLTCEQVKSEPAEWWEFVSWSCQECEATTSVKEEACKCPATAECECIREADEYEAWLNSRDYY